jgi:large subunit ribosomal protein L32
MAVPKRKMSRSNTRHRRSQWKASAPALATCANPACGAKHLPHRACPSCGQYGSRSDRRPVL